MTSTTTKTVAISPVKAALALTTVDVTKVDKGAALAMLSRTYGEADANGEGSAQDERAVTEAAAALARLRQDTKTREAKRGEARVALAIGVFALMSRKIATRPEIADAIGTSGAYVSQVASDGRRLIALGSTSPEALTMLALARKRSAAEADKIVADAIEATPAPVSDKPDARPRKVVVPVSTLREIVAPTVPAPGKSGRPARGEVRIAALASTIGRMHEAMTDADAKVVGSSEDRDALVSALTRMLAAAKTLPVA